MEFLAQNWQFLTGLTVALIAAVFVVLYALRQNRARYKTDQDNKAILLQLLNSIRNVEGKDWTVREGDQLVSLPPIEIDPGKINVHIDTQNWRVISKEHFAKLECPHTSNGRCKGQFCPAYRVNLKEGKDGCVAFEALFDI